MRLGQLDLAGLKDGPHGGWEGSFAGLRVPFGTLLCISDKPLHGEIKLPGMANAFYAERVSQHLKICLQAVNIVREDVGHQARHSRKLRSFDEPAFR